jgi:hypothetical protein
MSDFAQRQVVYEAIDTERDYQEKMKADSKRPDIIEDFHVGDALSAIQYNLDLARVSWYQGSAPHPLAMEYLRKIAGLCVQAGEVYGMPNRKF